MPASYYMIMDVTMYPDPDVTWCLIDEFPV